MKSRVRFPQRVVKVLTVLVLFLPWRLGISLVSVTDSHLAQTLQQLRAQLSVNATPPIALKIFAQIRNDSRGFQVYPPHDTELPVFLGNAFLIDTNGICPDDYLLV